MREHFAASGEGLALAKLGRPAEAAAAFEALLRRAPWHVAAARARAELLELRAR